MSSFRRHILANAIMSNFEAAISLEETNQVINDWQGKGNISYDLGAFLFSSESVPWLSWDRDFHRADLWKLGIKNSDPHTGTRVGIRI